MKLRYFLTLSACAVLPVLFQSVPARAMPEYEMDERYFDEAGNYIGQVEDRCEIGPPNQSYYHSWGDYSGSIRSMQLGPSCYAAIPSCEELPGWIATSCTHYCVTSSYLALVQSQIISDPCVQ